MDTSSRWAAGRLAERGIDAREVLGPGLYGGQVTTGDLYTFLGVVAASEKAGQDPTHTLARLALRAGLPSSQADALFLAYNQQSAEEAGHGDKVFGAAYYAMGGVAASKEQSVVGGDVVEEALAADSQRNWQTLWTSAARLGGIELVALQRVFPSLVALCERWQHPIARDLEAQIRDVIRPEESRHVLIWRYVFHTLVAPEGERAVAVFLQQTNAGRSQLGAPWLDAAGFRRMVGPSAPTLRQLMGKERVTLD